MSQTKLIANLFNPHLLPRDELIANFVIRLKEFRDIFNDIKSSSMEHPEQHYIIQGTRGTGKTSLLLRIYYEIKNDPDLTKWLIPLRFNEEQYHIRTLCKLWEDVIHLLEGREEFRGLYEQAEEMSEREDYDDICFDILSNALKEKKKKLVLFIDNIGDILNKFTETENNRLREILLASPDIRIIGASSVTLEHTYDYEKPFYDFFKFIYMTHLSSAETRDLLLKLSENYHEDTVRKILDKQPERVEALRRLTGGIPRTIVLLFEIFADDKSGDSFKDLEIILDRVTPLYKHRMDDLSAQQQEIVDVIAMAWDAISTKDIAKKVRMQSKAVSAQLKQLEKNRIIHKVETDTKNYLYQITERFFNIWYLMRYGRRKDRNRVLWLVRFLKEWCSREELIQRAKRHIEALTNKSFYPYSALYLTEALARTDLPMDLQHEMIEKTKGVLARENKELLKELSPSDQDMFNKAGQYFKSKKYDQCLRMLEKIQDKEAVQYNYGLLFHDGFKNHDKAKEYYLKAIDNDHVNAMFNLANLYIEQGENELAEEYYLKAIDKDHVSAMNNLANLYIDRGKIDKAEEYYLKAIDKGDVDAMFNIAYIYSEQGENEKAEEYYLRAIDKGVVGALNNLANIYLDQAKNEKAEEYYLKAIDKGNVDAMSNLAWFYFNQKRNKERALDLSRECYEKKNDLVSRINLVRCLIWNDKIERAIQHLKDVLLDKKRIEANSELIGECLIFLIAKKQYYLVLNLFQDEASDLKDRYKPIYYALMHFMQDEYPNEFKKMGDELKETVEEIIQKINQMSKDYV